MHTPTVLWRTVRWHLGHKPTSISLSCSHTTSLQVSGAVLGELPPSNLLGFPYILFSPKASPVQTSQPSVVVSRWLSVVDWCFHLNWVLISLSRTEEQSGSRCMIGSCHHPRSRWECTSDRNGLDSSTGKTSSIHIETFTLVMQTWTSHEQQLILAMENDEDTSGSGRSTKSNECLTRVLETTPEQIEHPSFHRRIPKRAENPHIYWKSITHAEMAKKGRF